MYTFYVRIIACFMVLPALHAQDKTIKTVAADTTRAGITPAASGNLMYFHPEEPDQLSAEKDTGLLHFYTRFDPTKLSGNEHVTTGGTFSPANRLLYAPGVNITFHHGYDQYNVYAKRFDNFRFYTATQPQTDVFFSQFANQLNFSAGARVAVPFRSGWSFSLDFFRVNEQGFYRSQAIKSTNLATGLRYIQPGGRYSFILGYTQHAHDEENNGGLIDPYTLSSFPLRSSAPVFIIGAKTRQQQRSFSVVQFLNLAGKKNWKLYARNTLLYEPSYFKFSHATTARDTLYYGTYLKDTRGIRRFIDLERYHAGFFLHGENAGGLRGSIGIRYDHFVLENQGLRNNRSDITAIFRGNLPLFKVFELQTVAALGLGGNAGNFDLRGSMIFNLKKWANLKGEARFYLSEPTYAQEILILNRETIFNQSLEKSFGSRFSGTLEIPFSKTSFTLHQHLHTNPVFWAFNENSTGKIDIETRQADLLSLTAFHIRQDLSFYNITFNHAVFFQFFNENLYNLPSWYSVHQLYYQFRIFRKALELSLGGELRLIPEYEGIGYSPVHGQFFSDDTTVMPFVPDADLVLNAKIKTFRISFILENAGPLLGFSHNFDVRDYPRMDPLLRFSLRWVFVN